MYNEIANEDYPLVSIVILNWNGKIYLKKCLLSLQCLTYPNYEVIVVDNGSSDGSPEIVKRDFKNVRLIANKCNLGVAKANNIGIKASNGDFVALLNNDVVVDPCWLSNLMQTAMQSPKIGIASGIVLQGKPSNHIWEIGKSMDAFTGTSWRIGYGKKFDELEKTSNIDYFSTCAALIRKELVKTFGLIDEGYFVYGEDADWAFCARRAGYECRLVPSAIIWHEGSASTKEIPSKRFYLLSVTNFRLYFKQFPLKYLFSTLVFQLIFVSIFQIFQFRAYHIRLKLKAFLVNIINLPEIMVERRKVESIGKLDLQPKFREVLKIFMAHEKGREY